MSGAEVIGVISAIIAIVDAGIKVYDAISDASGLPESFRDVAKRMGLIHVSLENIAAQLSKRELSDRAWKAINDVVTDCERKAKELDAIFRQALPDAKTSRMEKPLLSIRALGKGGKVDSLMDSIVKDVSILTLNHVSQSATESQMSDLRQRLDKLILLSSSHAGSPNPAAERDALLKELDWKDPQLAKNRIERLKGGLYDAASNWILSHPSYQLWKDADTDLLWIKGAAGKGKTMLLMTILKDLRARILQPSAAEGPLAFFFCQNKEPEANNAVSVLKGLIASLLIQDEQLAGVLKGHFDRLGKEAFDRTKYGDSLTFDLLATVFKDIIQSSRATKILLAVDALDECDLGRSDLIGLVTDTSIQHDNLKWVVTSRHHIRVPDSLALDLEVTQEAINQGIKAYISHKVSRIPAVASEPTLQERIEQSLFKKAEGTFLWVDRVLRIVQDLMSHELEQGIDEIPMGLTELYERMMSDLEVSGGRYQEPCLAALRVLTLAERPLNIQELQVLAGLGEYRRGDIEEVVNRCGSFVVLRPETGRIYPIHQSAVDFLLGAKSLDRVFPLGKGAVHHAMVENSLQAMSRILKRNIYGLEDLGALASEVTRPAPAEDPLHSIDYSCEYWVNHACVAIASGTIQPSDDMSKPEKAPLPLRFWQKIGREDKGINDERSARTRVHQSNRLSVSSRLKRRLSPGRQIEPGMDESERQDSNNSDAKMSKAQRGQTIDSDALASVATFIKKCLLYWLEATSLLGCVSQVALALARLQPVLDDSLSPENDAGKLLRDFYRFFIHHQAAIAEAPLQTYVSALLFSPPDSIVRCLFSDLRPQWVVRKPDAPDEWTSRHKRLDFTKSGDIYYTVSFSFDGSLFAALTQVCSAKRLNIWIWEMYSGRVVRKLEIDDAPTLFQLEVALTFSCDGTYLGLWTQDMVLIWHIETGALVSTFKSTRGERFKKVAFSRDSKEAVSASDSGAIRFWNVESGEEVLSQTAAAAPVKDANCMDLSSDGCHVAWSTSSDHAIRIRVVKSQQQPQKLTHHGKPVTRLLFSRKSQRLMSWSTDDKVRVWDVASGKAIFVDSIRSSSVGGTISVDGSLIAVPRDRGRVEILDTKSSYKKHATKLPSYWDSPYMEISPDNRCVALLERGLNIWDMKFISTIAEDDDAWRSNSNINTSMNGHCFVMVSSQGVRVWYMGQAGSDTYKEHWVGSYDEVREMSMSPDGERLAIIGTQGNQDSLTVWDTSTGRREFDVDEIADVNKIMEIRLSQRGTFLGFKSELGLMFCDGQSTSRVPQQGQRGKERWWRWVFSQDEIYYAVLADDAISVHKIKSGEQVWTLSYPHGPGDQVSPASVRNVTLSPTTHEVIRFNTAQDGILEVWNWSKHRKTVQACGNNSSLIFSPGGSYLLLPGRSGGSEIHLWDIRRNAQLASIDIRDLQHPNKPAASGWSFVASEDPSLYWLRTWDGDFKVAFRFSTGNNVEASDSTADPAATPPLASTLTCDILPWAKIGPWLCFRGTRMLRIPSGYVDEGDFCFSRDDLSFYVAVHFPNCRVSVMRLSSNPLKAH